MNKLSKITKRKQILALQDYISNLPGAMHGDCFPLKHSFANGMYMRQITVPKGMFIIGKIHKDDHPSFMLKGDVSILTERGSKRIKAPMAMISKAGDMRVGYVHEEMVWVDVFKTDVTDLNKIEAECVVTNYEAFDEYQAKRIKNFAKQICQK